MLSTKIFIFNTWHAANKYDLRLYIPLKVSYRTMLLSSVITHTRIPSNLLPPFSQIRASLNPDFYIKIIQAS